MAAWTLNSNDGANGGDSADNGEPEPLFGNFRRAPSTSDGEKPRSMTEMWGFGDENARREARRRRFWQIEETPEHEDETPWTRFRTPPVEPAEFAPEPSFGDAAMNDAFDPGLPAEQFEAPDDGEAVVEIAAEPDLAPAAAPVQAPSNGGRSGWRSFLAEVPPAFDRPRTPLPALTESAPPPLASTPPSFVQEPPRDESVTRLARRLTSVASAHPLVMETTVQLEPAVQRCTQLGRSWGADFEPTVADIAIRALARALQREPVLRELAKGIAVLDLGTEQGIGCVLESPSDRPFKETVGALAGMEATTLDEIDVSVTDYGLLSIERATPRLAPGQWLAIALGARVFGAVQNGEFVSWKPMANVCLAYDGQRVNDGAAARLLSRLRSFMEAPDDLIA